VVDPDPIRPAGQIEPARRLDPPAHGEDEQRVAARIGHPAPRRRHAVVEARHVRRTKAGWRPAEQSTSGVAQLDRALAAEQDDAAAVPERRHVARGSDGRGQAIERRRSAAGQHAERDRHDRE
jgi:hypothetical protein